MPKIVDVYRVQGMYDIIAKVELGNEEQDLSLRCLKSCLKN